MVFGNNTEVESRKKDGLENWQVGPTTEDSEKRIFRGDSYSSIALSHFSRSSRGDGTASGSGSGTHSRNSSFDLDLFDVSENTAKEDADLFSFLDQEFERMALRGNTRSGTPSSDKENLHPHDGSQYKSLSTKEQDNRTHKKLTTNHFQNSTTYNIPERVSYKESLGKENQFCQTRGDMNRAFYSSRKGNEGCYAKSPALGDVYKPHAVGVSASSIQRYSEEDMARYRDKLLNLVGYYKKNFNNGFGLIPIINSFTAKHKFLDNMVQLNETPHARTFQSLDFNKLSLTDVDFLRGLNYNNGLKRKDFSSKLKVRPGMKTVLYEVEFVKKGRWGLFQGVDFVVETGESLFNLLNTEVILEMDGGVDLAILRTVEYMPLISGIQEVPFMPVLRRPTHYDRIKYETKEQDELIVLRFCRELLKYPEFMHYNMYVTDVEFQIDRKKLIIYGEFVTRVKFNKYVKQVCEHCKHVFRGKNIKPRVFIQNKFVSAQY
eukprot:maker-scaffold_13-snap-gene-6.63-mRNA-1 protein AED:0.00 eAED:0.00 QI:60/1/1/1/1/1/2/418/489